MTKPATPEPRVSVRALTLAVWLVARSRRTQDPALTKQLTALVSRLMTKRPESDPRTQAAIAEAEAIIAVKEQS